MTGQNDKALSLQSAFPCALFLSGVALLLVSEKVGAGGWGFPFDDSWIFAQYARNLVQGKGFCFNAGEPSSGFTSFLWLLLCAVGYKLTGAFVVPMKAMGVLFGLGSVLVTHRLVHTLTDDEQKARWCSYLTALFPPLIANALAGMEGSLYVFTALVGIWLHLCGRTQPSLGWVGEGAWWGIATLARPENLLFWAAMTVDKLYRCYKARHPWRTVLLWLTLQGVAIAVFVTPWVAVNWLTTGTPFPCTYLAKVLPVRKVFYAHRGVFVGVIAALVQGWSIWLAWLLILFPTAITITVWSKMLPAMMPKAHLAFRQLGRASASRLWLLGVAAFVVSVHVVAFPNGDYGVFGHWGRYLLPAYLIAGWALMLNLASVRWAPLVALWGFALSGGSILSEYPQWVALTQRLHVHFGQWLRTHTPPDAVVATHDIGAIGFFSHRFIFDTQGLIHADIALRLPELWRDTDAMLREFQRRKVTYLVVVDRWISGVDRSEAFELLRAEPGWKLNKKMRFCIFRIRWERWRREAGRQRQSGVVQTGQAGGRGVFR